MRETVKGPSQIHGRLRAYRLSPTTLTSIQLKNPYELLDGHIWTPVTPWWPNLIVYEWGAIVGRALTLGDTRYRIGGMYLEFENVGSPGDPASAPAYDRTRNIDYYNALSGNRDYLRVPLTASTIDSSDDVLFPRGNVPTFFARSQGLQGVHALPFSCAENSVIFGAALVAFAHETDATQDLIFSVNYFPTDQQQPKLSTSQVGVEWALALT